MELQDYRDDLRERVVKIETIVQERVQHFSVLNSRVRKLEDSKLQVYTIVGFISFFVPIVLKALEII